MDDIYYELLFDFPFITEETEEWFTVEFVTVPVAGYGVTKLEAIQDALAQLFDYLTDEEITEEE